MRTVAMREDDPVSNLLAPYDLPYRLKLLVQLLTRHFQGELEPFHLMPFHWGVLCCLWNQDGMPTQAIAQRLEQLGGTVTVALDSMEKRGLIQRRPDKDDRRVSRVWLTPQGEALQAELVPRVRVMVAEMFSGFTEQEREEFSRLIDKLHDHVEAILHDASQSED